MRFVLFVIIAAATGAVSMTAMQTLVPSNASWREAVQALGGQWAAFRLADYQSAHGLSQSRGGDPQAEHHEPALYRNDSGSVDPGDRTPVQALRV
jgi:hypothetical protein